MLARQLVEEEYYEALPGRSIKPNISIVKPHRTVTRKKATAVANNGFRLKVASVLLLGAIMALSITWGRSAIASNGFALVQMQHEAAVLEKENQQLRIDNAKMKAPSRIKEIAVNKLGMTVPASVYFADNAKSEKSSAQ